MRFFFGICRGPGSAAASKDRYGFQTSNDAAEHRFDAVSSTNAVPYGSSGFGGSRWGSSGSGGSRDRFGSGGNGGSGKRFYILFFVIVA